MTTPITGPFVRDSGTSNASYYRRSTGWKQPRPFDQVLPYEIFIGSVLNYTGSAPSPNAWTMVGTSPIDGLSDAKMWDLATNACYEKIKSKISERAALGVALAEAEQSYHMIATRCGQLYRTFSHLRRGNLAGAQRELGLAIGKSKPASKAIADLYLEVHFGAVPLYTDIHDAVKSLQDPIKAQWVRARVEGGMKKYQLSTKSLGSNPYAQYPSLNYWDSDRYYVASHDVAMGCQVSVTNPNLWLANQMGLVNPFVIAHELIPFSFVGDWFMNVGQVLSAYSDFYGLGITNAWTTRRHRGIHHRHLITSYRWWAGNGWSFGGANEVQGGSFIHLRRTAGLTGPTFVVDGGRVWGLRRAAAALSLVTQFFHR